MHFLVFQDAIIEKMEEILADIYGNNEREKESRNNCPKNSTQPTEQSTNNSDTLESEQGFVAPNDVESTCRQAGNQIRNCNLYPNQNNQMDINDSSRNGNVVADFRSPPSTYGNNREQSPSIPSRDCENVDSFSLSDSDSLTLPPKVIMELTEDEPFSPIAKSTQKVIRCGHELERENTVVLNKGNFAGNDGDFMKKKSPDIARTYSVMANTAHIVDSIKSKDKMCTKPSESDPEVVVLEDINGLGEKEKDDGVHQGNKEGNLEQWSKGHSVSNSTNGAQVSRQNCLDTELLLGLLDQ